MQEMYAGKANSPNTFLLDGISETDTVIKVNDISVFPTAPNLAVIGTGVDAETIKYNAIAGDLLSGCERGFEGTAKVWTKGEVIARNFTNYDYGSLKANVEANSANIELANEANTKHISEKVTDEKGVHGIKYDVANETLLVDVNGEQVEVGGTSAKVGDVANLSANCIEEGRKVIVNLVKPTVPEFTHTEIYKATTDLNNIKYKDMASAGANKVYEGDLESYEDTDVVIGQTYYYKAFAVYNPLGVVTVSEGLTVSVIVKDETPPGPITNLSVAIGNGEAAIKYTLPTATDFKQVIARYGETPISSPSDGQEAYTGNLETFKITGLANGTNYHLAIFTEDVNGNVNLDGVSVEFTPMANIYEGRISNFSIVPSNERAIFSWTNPDLADFHRVEIRGKEAGYPTSPTDGFSAYSGNGTTAIVNHLTNGVEYFFRVFVFSNKNTYNDNTEGQELSTTPQANIYEGKISDFNVVQKGFGLDLTWKNPILEDFDRVVIRGMLGNYPDNPTDGFHVYSGTQESCIETVDPTFMNLQHNLRVFVFSKQGTYNDDIEGQTVSIVPRTNNYTHHITDLMVKVGNEKLTLNWKNPIATDFSKVVIYRKTEGYPTGLGDGTRVYDGNAETFVDNTVENDIEYFYRVFSYSTEGTYNDSIEEQQIAATPKAYVYYGVEVDYTNSNPETSVSYILDAVDMIPAQVGGEDGTWFDEFLGHYPVMLKDGVEGKKLDRNDFTKYEDGTTADITSGGEGDVMICFPRRGLKIETVGEKLRIIMTDNPNAQSEGFEYLAHTRGATIKDELYVGAFLGYNLSGKLRSLSGKTVTVNQTIGVFRNQAQANGAGYDQLMFYPLTYLQAMYLLKYKSTDSQTALGRGYVDGNSAAIVTGGTNKKGMDFGETTGKQQMKIFGIEDFWGNLLQWIDGLYSNSNYEIMTATQDFNDTGSGYANQGKGATANVAGYPKKVQGTTKTGFIVKDSAGSQTTHFCDYGALYSDKIGYFGGAWSGGSYAGAFALQVDYSASYSASYVGGRLLFL